MNGQITPAGRELLAQLRQPGAKSTGEGNDFELLVRHIHGEEAVRQRTLTYLVWLTKELVPPKPPLRGRKPGKARTKVPTLRTIVTNLQKADQYGSGGPLMNDALLQLTVADFIGTDKVLKPLTDQIRAGNYEPWIKDLDKLEKGTLGDKKPDLFEFDLTTNTGTVTDFTLKVGDPVHALKTLIDSMVLEIASGGQVAAYDWRSASNSRQITAGEISAQLSRRARDRAQQRRKDIDRISQGQRDSKDQPLKWRQDQRERERRERRELLDRDDPERGSTKAGEAIDVTKVATSSNTFAHVLRDHLDDTGAAVIAGTVPLAPARQVSSFYNAANSATTKDSALQAKLDALLHSRRFRQYRHLIAIAVADLTGPRLLNPLYASHNDAENFYAASTGKITGLLAAYQLLADVREFLAQNPTITTKEALVPALAASWQQAGISAKDHPDVANLLVVETGTPTKSRLRAQLIARFNAISAGNMNGSTAMVLLKFPYIASALLAHGLFRPVDRSGLWSREAFGPIRWIPWNGYSDEIRSIRSWGRQDPFPRVPSNSVSAASITQFMTLAGQGRLVDRASSSAILRHLQRGGCVPENLPLADLNATGAIAVKCGIWGGEAHVPLHFRAADGSREFVITILTRGYVWNAVGNALFDELKALV
jgi:hypothetical protein